MCELKCVRAQCLELVVDAEIKVDSGAFEGQGSLCLTEVKSVLSRSHKCYTYCTKSLQCDYFADINQRPVRLLFRDEPFQPC